MNLLSFVNREHVRKHAEKPKTLRPLSLWLQMMNLINWGHMVKAFTSSRESNRGHLKCQLYHKITVCGHCALNPRVRKSSKFTCRASSVLHLISPPQRRGVYIIQWKHVQGISHFASKCLTKYDTISEDRNIFKEFNTQLLSSSCFKLFISYICNLFSTCFVCSTPAVWHITSCSEPDARLLLQH